MKKYIIAILLLAVAACLTLEQKTIIQIKDTGEQKVSDAKTEQEVDETALNVAEVLEQEVQKETTLDIGKIKPGNKTD